MEKEPKRVSESICYICCNIAKGAKNISKGSRLKNRKDNCKAFLISSKNAARGSSTSTPCFRNCSIPRHLTDGNHLRLRVCARSVTSFVVAHVASVTLPLRKLLFFRLRHACQRTLLRNNAMLCVSHSWSHLNSYVHTQSPSEASTVVELLIDAWLAENPIGL